MTGLNKIFLKISKKNKELKNKTVVARNNKAKAANIWKNEAENFRTR